MKLSGFNNAVILLDKPAGRTSFDTISEVRRLAGIKKIGHSGTLDKFASGLLVICTGGATRLTRYFLESDKRYTGIIKLGVATDTCDVTGEVVAAKGIGGISESLVRGAVSSFSGEMSQLPPLYSSLKIAGRRASDRVRNGEEVELAERNIRIDRFDITGIDIYAGEISFDIICSKGTYIRSIARDLGEKLGTGAMLLSLRRRGSGSFGIENAADMETVRRFIAGEGEGSFIIDPAEALKGFGRVVVNSTAAAKVKNGALFESGDAVISGNNQDGKPFIIEDSEKNLIAIADIDIAKWQIIYHSVFNARD